MENSPDTSNKISSSTLLSTPKKKGYSSEDQTLLVTEKFHLSSKEKNAAYRRRDAWKVSRTKLIIIAFAVISILLGFVLFYWNSQDTPAVVTTENKDVKVSQVPTPRPPAEQKRDIVVQGSENKPVGTVVKQKHIDNSPIVENTDSPGPAETENAPTAELAGNKTADSKPVITKKDTEFQRTTTVPNARPKTGTAFSNVFSYGMQNNSRLTSPGTAEGNLRSSKYRNSTGISYGTSRRNTRARRRRNDSLRFRIKDSGTRSVH